MNILFVCKHNRFRSKVAEAVFKKLNKNKSLNAKSAGISLDLLRPHIAENIKKVLFNKGIKNLDEISRQINKFDVKWADKIIIVSNNIDVDTFPKQKTIVWKIPDADEQDFSKIKKIVSDIEKKVKLFIKLI